MQRRVREFKRAIPWLMDLISIVLGIFSWAVASTDLRLTLDLNSVFIRVDFPRPLCPVSKNTERETYWERHTNTHLKTKTNFSTVLLLVYVLHSVILWNQTRFNYCSPQQDDTRLSVVRPKAETSCRRPSAQTLSAKSSIHMTATQTQYQTDWI